MNRIVIASLFLVVTGCSSAAPSRPPGEMSVIRLRNPQTGQKARCGAELIREVQRGSDLTFSEELFYAASASRAARQALRDEEAWRQQCVERYRQQGFEVVS